MKSGKGLNLDQFVTKKAHSIETRREATQDNFVQVKNKNITTTLLTDEAKVLLFYLKTHNIPAYTPGYNQIEMDMTWSRSKITRAIRCLERAGKIQRTNAPNQPLRLDWIEEV